MHRWLGDPRTTRHLTWGSGTFEDTERHLREILDDREGEERRSHYHAVVLIDTGEVIGGAGFHFTHRDEFLVEGAFGYFLAPPFRGRGYGTEAARLTLRLAFEEHGATRMTASCAAENRASRRVLEKCGMRRVAGAGTRLRFAMRRSDWRSRRD